MEELESRSTTEHELIKFVRHLREEKGMAVIYSLSMCNAIYVIHASNIYIYLNYLYVDPAGLARSVSFTCI